MLGTRQRQRTMVVWAAMIVLCTSSMTAASSAYKNLEARKSLSAPSPRPTSLDSIEGEDNDSYKSQDEWWKDPLAMFEDEEEGNKDAADNNKKIPASQDNRKVTEEEEDDMIEFFPEDLPEEGDHELGLERQPEEEGKEEVELLPEEDDAEEMIEMIDEPMAYQETMREDSDTFVEIPEEELQPAQSKKRNPAVFKRQEPVASDTPKKKQKSPASKQKSHTRIGSEKSKQVVSASGSLPLAFTGMVPQLTSLLSTYPGVKLLGLLALGKAVSAVMKTAVVPRSKRIDAQVNIDETESTYVPQEADPETTLDEEYEQEEQEAEEVEQEEETVRFADSSTQRLSPTKQRTGHIVKRTSGWLRIFGKSKRERLPPARELMEQVEEFKRLSELAESDKKNLEREYEKTSWQLQEAQSELKNLKQTTRYLQAQLRDNEEMLSRVVKSERRKAKDELVRMKEAMVNVVEKEREAMRDEFMKQAAELQTIWKGKKKVYAD